jgi:hypothetical protein
VTTEQCLARRHGCRGGFLLLDHRAGRLIGRRPRSVFLSSYLGSLGPTAVRCLFSLADLELRQHDSSLVRQGLPPLLDPSARSQFRAIAYRQISARIGIAVAKASVMRFLGVPRLPLPPFLPRAALARNRPGPADSFSPPVPLSNASSLSLPSVSSQSVSSFSPVPSP